MIETLFSYLSDKFLPYLLDNLIPLAALTILVLGVRALGAAAKAARELADRLEKEAKKTPEKADDVAAEFADAGADALQALSDAIAKRIDTK